MDQYDWQSSLVKFALYVVDTERSNRAAYIEQSKSRQIATDRGDLDDKCLPIHNDPPMALRPSTLQPSATA